MKRPFAAFDIDGTVIRWQLYHAIADQLAKSGHIDPTQFEQVRRVRRQWKNRNSQNSFKNYEETLVSLVDTALTGITVRDVKKACEAVLSTYKDQVYTYTRTLIRDLKDKNYVLFAISASQIEIVGPIADYYGFDDYGGSEFEIINGHFTGNKKVLQSTHKPEFLKELVAKHHVGWEHSIAIGDSESDISMLDIVERPIAFNPTVLLFDYARAHNWKIVIERKNKVYELEPRGSTYILAE